MTCNPDDAGEGTDVFAGFDDGPVTLPTGIPAPPIAQLALPKGKHAISATLNVVNKDDTYVDFVNCELRAGADFDLTSVALPPYGEGGSASRLALSVVHEFSAPGDAVLGCSGFTARTQFGEWSFLKITAIGVANLSTAPLTLP